MRLIEELDPSKIENPDPTKAREQLGWKPRTTFQQLIQEMVRAFWTDWYRELVTGLPIVEQGQVRPSPGPGLGVELRPDLGQRPDAIVRRTTI